MKCQGVDCLRSGSGGRLLWTTTWIFGFCAVEEISWWRCRLWRA